MISKQNTIEVQVLMMLVRVLMVHRPGRTHLCVLSDRSVEEVEESDSTNWHQKGQISQRRQQENTMAQLTRANVATNNHTVGSSFFTTSLHFTVVQCQQLRQQMH